MGTQYILSHTVDSASATLPTIRHMTMGESDAGASRDPVLMVM